MCANCFILGAPCSCFTESTPLPQGLSPTKKSRKRFPHSQCEMLKEVFRMHPYPSRELREELASRLAVTPRCIQIWFQNARAKCAQRCLSCAKGMRAQRYKRHAFHLHTWVSSVADLSGADTGSIQDA
jgi:hypothetical protein